MLRQQMAGDGAGAFNHMGVIAFAVGRVAAVRHVHKVFKREFGAQRPQHAQAADAAVKHPDGVLD